MFFFGGGGTPKNVGVLQFIFRNYPVSRIGEHIQKIHIPKVHLQQASLHSINLTRWPWKCASCAKNEVRVYQHQFDRHENLYFQKYSTVEYVEFFLPSPAFNRNLPSPTFNKIESHFRVLFGQHLIFSVRILVSGRVGLVVCSTYIPFVFPLVETMFIRDRVFCEHFLGFVLRCFFIPLYHGVKITMNKHHLGVGIFCFSNHLVSKSQVDSTLTQRMIHSPKERGSLETGYLQTLQLWLVNRTPPPPQTYHPPPEIAGLMIQGLL